MIEAFDLKGHAEEMVVLLAIPFRMVLVQREAPPGTGSWVDVPPEAYALDRRILTIKDPGPAGAAGRLYVMYRVRTVREAIQNLGVPGP